MDKFLSIIIPVYNTPIDVLKRCVSSVAIPNNIGYEIIIVNDGSTDENSKLYNGLINENTRVIYKENGGVSSARNLGLESSNGKYILFVDSDDVLISKNINWDILNDGYDLIFYDYTIIKKDNKKNIYIEISKDKSCEIIPDELIYEFIYNDKFFCPFSKFIKKSFLVKNSIKFNSIMINGEDAIFNFDVLCSSPKIYYEKRSIYEYYYASINYERRICEKFDRTVDDYLLKYERKCTVIKDRKLSGDVLIKIQNKCVEQLYRISMICSSLKMNKKEELMLYLTKSDVDYSNLTFFNKIKYIFISQKKWLFINICSYIRKFYLKIKRV